jgi:hypothetical protein
MVNRVGLDISDPATPSNFAVLESAMLWKFWKLCRISLARETVGYEYRLIPEAQDFLENQILRDNYTQNNFVNFPNHLNQNTKSTLFSFFSLKILRLMSQARCCWTLFEMQCFLPDTQSLPKN